MQKKVIEIKLNEYAPIRDNTCTTSADHDHVYEIRFHGNPVNIFPLQKFLLVKLLAQKIKIGIVESIQEQKELNL